LAKTENFIDEFEGYSNGETTNISIKKRASGQAYLVTARNFVSVYEAQYGVKVPESVRKALSLFIGENPQSRHILESTDISVEGEKANTITKEQN
jgi:hypothetical protein